MANGTCSHATPAGAVFMSRVIPRSLLPSFLCLHPCPNRSFLSHTATVCPLDSGNAASLLSLIHLLMRAKSPV